MSLQKCNLVFTGRFVNRIDQETVYENLAEVFKTDVDKARAKFVPDTPVIIKKDADRELCIKMQATIQNAGAECEIKPVHDLVKASAEEEVFSTQEKESAPEKAAEVNPYSAPKSNIRVENNMDGSSFTGPHAVPAGNGLAWIAKGISLFFMNPFRWILAMILYFICNLIQIIPLIGPFIMMLINPHLVAGLFHGAKELDEDGISPSPTCIFKGFSQNAGSLVLLGLSIMGFAILFGIAVVLVMLLSMGINFSDFGNPEAMQNITSPGLILLPFLIMLLIVIPVSMCFWFAIPLVGLNGMNVFESFGTSFSACMKNILPFLIYGLIFFGLYMVLMVIIAVLVPQLAIGESKTGIIVMMLIFLPIFLSLMPIGMLSMYGSYKDIFYRNQA